MNLFNAVSLILSILLAAFPWIFPDWELEHKIIFALAVLIAYILAHYFGLHQKRKSAVRELEDVRGRHSALSKQFDEKLYKERRYKRAIEALGGMLTIAATNSKEAKFHEILKAFHIALNNIDEEGE